MPEDLREKLDNLIKKLEDTFENCKDFKQDKRFKKHWYVWESKLDYDITSFLMNGNGRCNWDNIQYICQHGGYSVYAGEQDSFGWLSGVIEKDYEDGSSKAIMYG